MFALDKMQSKEPKRTRKRMVGSALANEEPNWDNFFFVAADEKHCRGFRISLIIL